jgi:hypothetical protein
MHRFIYPGEEIFEEQHRSGYRWAIPPILEVLLVFVC